VNSSRNLAIALSVVCSIGCTSPVFAQLSCGAEPLDEVGSAHSKIVDIDIVTNSPTLQGQSTIQQPQVAASSSWSPRAVQSGLAPQQTSTIEQNVFSSQQYSSVTPNAAQNVAKQPIQIDSQTVGRVVGVAGTALILGAFLKNGGVGGMMNTFGLDNRFHSRGSSLAPY